MYLLIIRRKIVLLVYSDEFCFISLNEINFKAYIILTTEFISSQLAFIDAKNLIRSEFTF